MGYFTRVARAASVLGRAIMGSTGYEGASTGRRLASWNETDEAISALLQSEGDTMRRRSRALCRKNHWARCAQDSYVANTIGTGIKPQSLHPDPGVRKQIHELWSRWCDEADADGLTDFYGMQALGMREQFEAGEVLARLRPRYESDGLSVPLQIEMLEAEHLPLTDNRVYGGNIVRGGIEFAPHAKRAAYWVTREHPGMAGYSISANPREQIRVPADRMIHCFLPRRAKQYRGEPYLSPVMVTLYELDQFVDAVLVRQKLANMFLGWQRSANPDDPVVQSTTTDEAGNMQPEGSEVARLEAGVLWDLSGTGDTLEFNDPPSPGAEFHAFLKMMLHAVASGIGIPYTLLNWDTSDTSYSSMRGELLEFRRRIEQLQFGVQIFQFCRPIRRRWINDAVLVGALPQPRNQQEWTWLYATKWRTPKWAWVDPLKDVLAAKEMVRNGFDSQSGIIHETGEDPEVVAAEQAADNARNDSLGLVVDCDPRKVANNGAAQKFQEQEQLNGKS